MTTRKNLIGQTFGKLIVLEYSHTNIEAIILTSLNKQGD